MHADRSKHWGLAAVAVVTLAMAPSLWAQARPIMPPPEPPAPRPKIDPKDLTSEQVRKAIDSAIAAIRNQQGDDGRWGANQRFNAGWQDDGTTCLMVLALLNAGVGSDDPDVKAGLAAVRKISNEYTYVTALKCQALAAAGGDKHKADLQAAATALMQGQLDNGMWSYNCGPKSNPRVRGVGRGDNSNTQFALLGLHEAAKAGIKVPKAVWDASRRHFENTQLADGGWMYYYYPQAVQARLPRGVQVRSNATATMTAAGVASLYICGQRLFVGGKGFRNGVYKDCGKYQQNKAIAGGLKWLGGNFDSKVMLGWNQYYLYALERVGMIGGLRNFGTHDWYREGAAALVSAQGKDGTWNQPLYNTALALLFLAKGDRPVLFQKLQWEGDWNRNRFDVENLLAFIGDDFGENLTWQSITAQASIEELHQAPILYITGHDFPALDDKARTLLRRYVESGGTIVFDACCSSDKFRQGFEQFASAAFKEYKVRKLDASHPVFNSFHDVDSTYGLMGIDVGCRTGVFFATRAMSPLWELRTAKDEADPKVTSELALKLGMNIAAYATGNRGLARKLDEVELPPLAQHAAELKEVPRGAVRIARLAHSGDFDADVHCLLNLTALLRDRAKVDVVAQSRVLRANDPKLYNYPVVFMSGHYKFELSADEIKALRTYLQHGGTLVADACCGQKDFDESFRKLCSQLFPKDDLKALPADHAVYAGKTGIELGEIKYRPVLARELKARGTAQPPLECVKVEGRNCILYSRYDFSCALEGDNPFSCRGYTDTDGRRLALAVFLYAIGY